MTNYASKTHSYHGRTIHPCDYEPGKHRGRWRVQTYHSPSGMPWADESCPHFNTLAAAKESIDERIAQDAVAGVS